VRLRASVFDIIKMRKRFTTGATSEHHQSRMFHLDVNLQKNTRKGDHDGRNLKNIIHHHQPDQLLHFFGFLNHRTLISVFQSIPATV